MSLPAATLEDVLAVLREVRAALRGRATKRQRPRLDALLLPLQHAAELLGVSRPTLRNLVRAGELVQVQMINGDPRISRRSLEEYLERLEHAPAKKRPAAVKVPVVRAPPTKPRRKRSGAEVAAAIRAISIKS